MDPLKFVVLDEEDLEVASAHLQDAVLKVSDILWRPQEKRVVIALHRFDWEGAQGAQGAQGARGVQGVQGVQGADPQYQRRLAALRFERVLSCKCRQVDPVRKDAVLNLLAVEFSETEAPSGVIMLTFSGGASVRLEVECLEAELADLGPSWTAASCPSHADVDVDADAGRTGAKSI
jgi:hypothetical protein